MVLLGASPAMADDCCGGAGANKCKVRGAGQRAHRNTCLFMKTKVFFEFFLFVNVKHI